MFTKEDILSRLQKGDSADAIAAEMSDLLNAAEKEHKDLEAQKAATNFILSSKREAALELLFALCNYLEVAGYEDLVPEVRELSADSVMVTIDESVEMIKALGSLADYFM